MTPTLAFIHTSPVLIPAFTQLAAELLDGVKCFHMVDESLIKNTIAEGHLTSNTARRVLSLIESARQAGASAVLVTCSSIGEAVAASRPFIDVPVLRIDEAMAEAAIGLGTRIGVAATLRTTLEPTLALLQATGHRLNRPVQTIPCLCEGAFEAVLAGDTARHDAMVVEALTRLVKEVDAVVLAQASMARVLGSVDAGGTPILASPRLAVESARRLLLPQ
ncbi:MAG: Asp/Glu/hydantoin racemase [Acidobacteria bacterium]|nr:Asp/Glu/hydantoin racemase [Acidobacteriota bacterium]